jgi:hypothetical protein
MKHRIGPSCPARSLRTAMYSMMRFLTFSRPKWSSSRQRRVVVDVELVGRGLAPRQVGEPLEVGARDVELGRLLLHPGEAPSCFARPSAPRRAEPASASFAELLDLVVVAPLAELLLDGRICWRRICSRWPCPRRPPSRPPSSRGAARAGGSEPWRAPRARAPSGRTSRGSSACRRRSPARASGSRR